MDVVLKSTHKELLFLDIISMNKKLDGLLFCLLHFSALRDMWLYLLETMGEALVALFFVLLIRSRQKKHTVFEVQSFFHALSAEHFCGTLRVTDVRLSENRREWKKTRNVTSQDCLTPVYCLVSGLRLLYK